MLVSAVVPVLVTATTTLLKSERSDGDVTSVSVRQERDLDVGKRKVRLG